MPLASVPECQRELPTMTTAALPSPPPPPHFSSLEQVLPAEEEPCVLEKGERQAQKAKGH